MGSADGKPSASGSLNGHPRSEIDAIVCAVPGHFSVSDLSLFLLFLPPLPTSFLPSLPIPLPVPLPILAAPLSGIDSDVFPCASGTLCRDRRQPLPGCKVARIASGSGDTFAPALRALACAFANVLAALAYFVAEAGLDLLLPTARRGLRRGGPLILRRISGACQCPSRLKKSKVHATTTIEANLDLIFIFFLLALIDLKRSFSVARILQTWSRCAKSIHSVPPS